VPAADDLVDHHHGDRESAQIAAGKTGMTDRLVQFEVTGGALAGTEWLFSLRTRLSIRGLLKRDAGRRRLVAECTRYALNRGLTTGLLIKLLTAQGGQIGIEALLGLLGNREVQTGGDLGANIVVAENRGKNILHPLLIVLLQLFRVLKLAGSLLHLPVVHPATQQISPMINHRHLTGFQFGYAGGHQMNNRGYLGFLQRTTGVEFHHHRCTRFLAFAHKDRLLGGGQMDPCGLYVAQGGDGARQFLLQDPVKAGRFQCPASPEPGLLLQHLVAHAAAVRQSLAGKIHPRFLQFSGRHHDGTIVLVYFERDSCLLQGGNHLGGILRRQTAIEEAVAGGLGPEHHGHTQCHAGGNAYQYTELPDYGVLPKAGCLQLTSCNTFTVGGFHLRYLTIL